ncbi:MAG: sulfate ABC transporter permease subunit CysW [Deltaproteobacteria bacterium]|nr:sulfate ABC transporter permease subunit CysW [Deltaproteobacteria bacterium]
MTTMAASADLARRATVNNYSNESRPVQILLISVALIFLSLVLLVPLFCVFTYAFEKGIDVYFRALSDTYTLSAIRLTLFTAAIAVPLNLIFGISAAWLIARFHFPGRQVLLTMIDLPLAVSPVIAGMIFVLLYGQRGLLHPIIEALGIQIIFAPAGIVLATTFVTLPFVARELVPVMLEQGSAEEEAALTMGASGWHTFFLITLPNIKWALLYGVILCNARAMGEFGAVSVVSGHIRGLTNTLPLHIEVLYNEYNFTAAFAVSSLLALLAIVTLVAKAVVEWKYSKGNS